MIVQVFNDNNKRTITIVAVVAVVNSSFKIAEHHIVYKSFLYQYFF